MTATAEVLHCVECGRPMRHAKQKAADHPGTIVRGTRELCVTHYKATRPPSPSEGHRFPVTVQAPAEVVFATVPGRRKPHQSDSRPSCCKNPYLCRTGYACACHGGAA